MAKTIRKLHGDYPELIFCWVPQRKLGLKQFYVDTLKLEIIEEFKSDWLLLKAGNYKIGLHKIGKQYLNTNKGSFTFDNNTKIVFEIDENIYEIREQLIKKNVTLQNVKTFDNYQFLFCDGKNPEGNIFQLKQRKNN